MQVNPIDINQTVKLAFIQLHNVAILNVNWKKNLS